MNTREALRFVECDDTILDHNDCPGCQARVVLSAAISRLEAWEAMTADVKKAAIKAFYSTYKPESRAAKRVLEFIDSSSYPSDE